MKKRICVFITAVLFMAVATPVKKTLGGIGGTGRINYVALGDSLATGFGLGSPGTESYPSLFKGLLEPGLSYGSGYMVNLFNEATDGLTSGLLLDYLQIATPAALEPSAGVAFNGIITLSIGGNDILGPMTGVLNQALSQILLSWGYTDIKQATPAQLQQLGQTLGSLSLTTEQLGVLQAGVQSFASNFPKIITRLKQIAPNATLIVTTVYNPIPVAMGLHADADKLVSAINKIIWDYKYLEYEVADTYYAFDQEADKNPSVPLTNFNLAAGSLDIHPNAEGHRIMADVHLFAYQRSISQINKDDYVRFSGVDTRLKDFRAMSDDGVLFYQGLYGYDISSPAALFFDKEQALINVAADLRSFGAYYNKHGFIFLGPFGEPFGVPSGSSEGKSDVPIDLSYGGATWLSSSFSVYNISYANYAFKDNSPSSYTGYGPVDVATGELNSGQLSNFNAYLRPAAKINFYVNDYFIFAGNGSLGNPYVISTRSENAVKYNGNGHTGGTVPDTEEYLSDSPVTVANPPTKTGYTFVCWQDQDNVSYLPGSMFAMPGNSLTLTAVWIKDPVPPKTHTVTFNLNGGTAGVGGAPLVQSIVHGEKATPPNDPTKDGFTFVGWYDALTNEKKTDFTIESDTIYYAQWAIKPPDAYTVTFDLNGGGLSIIKYVSPGDSAIPPADPARDGYTFIGWYDAPSGGAPAVFTNIKSNTTYYARWTQNSVPQKTYKVRFHLNGGIAAAGGAALEQDITPGGTAIQPAIPSSKYGYVFDGWYDAPTGGNLVYNFSNITSNRDYYAQWRSIPLNAHTVIFHLNGGTHGAGGAALVQTVVRGGSAARPADPTRAGYTFAGWYDAPSGGNRVTDFTDIRANNNYYAQWVLIPGVSDDGDSAEQTDPVQPSSPPGLRVTTKVPTLVNGRYGPPEEHFAATVSFTFDGRKNSLELPQGVKVRELQIINDSGLFMSYIGNDMSERDGKILVEDNIIKLPGLDALVNGNNPVTVTVYIWVSIVSGYEGDIVLTNPDKNESAVIAKAVSPIIIKTTTTDRVRDTGLSLNTADITITETSAGMLQQKKSVYLTISFDSSVADRNDFAFAEYQSAATGIEIKNFSHFNSLPDFNNTSGVSFSIIKESASPAEIKITGIQLQLNKEVTISPYDYRVIAWGPAIAANYGEKEDQFPVPGISADYLQYKSDSSLYNKNVTVIIETEKNDPGTVNIDIATSIKDSDTVKKMYTVTSKAGTTQIGVVSGNSDNNNPLVPLRLVANALGIQDKEIIWDAKNRSVTITANNRDIRFTVGSAQIIKNGEKKIMENPDGTPALVEIHEDRVYLPFRTLGEAFGIPVAWDNDTQTATFNQQK